MKARNVFKKYIDFIQFPLYRNIELDTRIVFDFPLTVFTGQNGCGKSSALHALWGTVQGNTPYRFWFDTKIDPIEYFGEKRRRQSFWYSYKDNDGNDKEVVKVRIKRDKDPNYWETSRPILEYGMRNLEGLRNAPLKKNCIYLDFRSELSAFDQFFYFGDVSGNKSKNNQEYLRKKSSQLKPILDGIKTTQLNSSGKPLNKPLRILNNLELANISFILGRKYKSGKILEHKLYRNEGYSVYFESNFANYSEAFAGSGEVAIVRLVTEILNAPNYSLVLLDEPEVSLHPGAQKRLQEFLLEQIKLKKLQIILNTHSPSLINGLPKESIKVFHLNPNSSKFSVISNLSPNEAFFHIEYEVHKRPIYVEDRLAKLLLSEILKDMGEEKANLFNIEYHAGGAEILIKQVIPLLCRNSNPNDFVFFDGDQKLSKPINWRSIPHLEITLDNLIEITKELTNHKIEFMVDGDGVGNTNQKIDLHKKYLDFYLNSTYFFPKGTPEELIWDQEYSELLLRDTNNKNVIQQINGELNFKQKFRILTLEITGVDDSDTIFATHRNFTKRFVQKKDIDYESIKNKLEEIIQKVNID